MKSILSYGRGGWPLKGFPRKEIQKMSTEGQHCLNEDAHFFKVISEKTTHLNVRKPFITYCCLDSVTLDSLGLLELQWL